MFSILIPVYNSALYIEQCIKSIKNQSYKNFECIIVNDGSTDNSLDLINDIIENDARFTVISQSNKGISDTRNKLLEMSNGEYIVWVDSDDFVDMDLLYTLWEKKFHAVVMMHIVLIILALEVLPVN